MTARNLSSTPSIPVQLWVNGKHFGDFHWEGPLPGVGTEVLIPGEKSSVIVRKQVAKLVQGGISAIEPIKTMSIASVRMDCST